MSDLIIMPRLSLNEEASLLSEWYVQEGDRVEAGDKLFCVETDKSTLDVESGFSGIVLKKYYSDYEVVDVLSPVCVIGEEGDDIPELNKTAEIPEEVIIVEDSAPTVQQIVNHAEPVMFSPRARILAKKNGVSMTAPIVPGGAENRILEEDVIRFMESGKTAAATIKKLSKIRKVISSNMMNSLQSTAQLSMNSLFNATAIMTLRDNFKKEQGAMKDVTIGDMVLYATTKTLSELPYMNTLAKSDQEVMEYKTVNLGYAVDTERGLMVPTLFQAESKSLLELSCTVKQLAASCNNGSISPDKLSGGTFTVSNLGALGVRNFTPILNPPQVGILGVGTIDYMARNTRQGMLYYPAGYLSLTFDHRIIDGGPAARFLKQLCENLERMDELISKEMNCNGIV